MFADNFRKALNIMSIGCDGPRIPEIVVQLTKVQNSAVSTVFIYF